MAVTMCHYMKSVKKSRTSKQGIPKTTKAALHEKSHKSHSMNSRTPLGIFGVLPREMRFGIFGFTLPADLGQLSLTSRKFRDEIMDYIHKNDALIIIVPKINQNSEEDSSELFITLETEYCCNHFKDLGDNFDAVTQILIIIIFFFAKRIITGDHTVYFLLAGILLKRATCLFSTKERLKEVGIILDKVIHQKIVVCIKCLMFMLKFI